MKLKSFQHAARTAALAAVAFAGLTGAPAVAQNPDHVTGDLLIYFLQFGGSQTILARLSLGVGGYTTTAPAFRDATSNSLNIIDLSAQLVGTFGASWYEDENLYWGLAAARSSSTGTTTQLDGDPNRTIYVSQERTAVGTEGSAQSPGWSIGANGDMTTGATNIIQLHTRLETIGLNDRLVEGVAGSPVDNQNPFLGSNPGTAYGIFPGGVVGNFGTGSFGTLGGVNAESALDLYRILASTSASGQVGGTLREGSFEGTMVINQSGQVSFVAVPEPGTETLLGSAFLVGLLRRNRSRRT